MTQEEYQELESHVPNPNSVSTEKYNQIVKNESQKIANEENKTINTPQGVLTPVTENKNKSSEGMKNQDSNSQVLQKQEKATKVIYCQYWRFWTTNIRYKSFNIQKKGNKKIDKITTCFT
ncbi:hypothetical protein [Staphylococcus hominis]|uniref:hypothetical protein n=1 Tax=Staphylococcus hominis TaxID=1290 RepID=UPI001F5B7D81|nr:hypothetical protein [Staphylococcus hominis]